MKNVFFEEYKGFMININAEYLDYYYDPHEHDTIAVKFHLQVLNGEETLRDSTYTSVKEKPFLFFKPKTTFKQQVEEDLNHLIESSKHTVDRYYERKRITDGLFESLEGM